MALGCKGKVAIVTGASGDMGAAIAKLLARNGAIVVVNYFRSKEKADSVVGEITQAGGRAIAVYADITERQQVDEMVHVAIKEFGRIDILVNNAAVVTLVKPFLQISWEEFQRKLVSELRAIYNCCQAVLPQFIKQGNGRIVNISAGSSRHPLAGLSAGSVTKAAIDALSRAMALELGQYGITVNVVAPGLVLTERSAQMANPELIEKIKNDTPLGRLGRPEDIAGAVLMLVSDETSFVTGQYLHVSGGWVMI